MKKQMDKKTGSKARPRKQARTEAHEEESRQPDAAQVTSQQRST